MRQHFAFEILLNAFLERNSLGIAQFGIRLGLAVTITADFGCFVALTQSGKDCLEFRGSSGARRERDPLA